MDVRDRSLDQPTGDIKKHEVTKFIDGELSFAEDAATCPTCRPQIGTIHGFTHERHKSNSWMTIAVEHGACYQ